MREILCFLCAVTLCGCSAIHGWNYEGPPVDMDGDVIEPPSYDAVMLENSKPQPIAIGTPAIADLRQEAIGYAQEHTQGVVVENPDHYRRCCCCSRHEGYGVAIEEY